MKKTKKLGTPNQGDVLFIPIVEIPAEAKETEGAVLVRGESTGHTHRLAPGAQAAILMVGAVMYLRVLKACQVIHEEHKPISLPEGLYEVRRQQEYTLAGWRQVND